MTSTQWPETRDGEQASAFKIARVEQTFFFSSSSFAVDLRDLPSFVDRLTRLSRFVMEFFIQFEMDLQ